MDYQFSEKAKLQISAEDAFYAAKDDWDEDRYLDEAQMVKYLRQCSDRFFKLKSAIFPDAEVDRLTRPFRTLTKEEQKEDQEYKAGYPWTELRNLNEEIAELKRQRAGTTSGDVIVIITGRIETLRRTRRELVLAEYAAVEGG